ncbi:FAD-dependent oxidoreductase [Spirosoma endbachense]|uniref:FAD-dependent oxidoreductase n=1 Tax=Spirosoma endbachense TaxID=2666025 RepID=A0A6P1VW65_9BACT|nr:FAD-dependent oxidoreductase [Spirosoma endbachense]QHV96874.1 FAD-dependent oxidoreductase [Spirosoma endbachense]
MPTTRRHFLKLSGLSGLAITAGLAELHAGNAIPLAENDYDLIIVGATPGGIMAAVAASRLGKKSLILERTAHIGGLPANGLGATDIATRGATGGLFLEFVQRIRAHYVGKYGADSQQVKDCSDGYHFEPSVAARIFADFLKESPNATVLTMRQFDFEPENLTIQNNKIEGIRVTDRNTKKAETYRGRFFIDATYEGDLIAAAGVPFFLGREGKSDYNEVGAGRVYKYWAGPEGPGSTFQGDNAVQSYNYRLCVTNDPTIRVKIQKPARYNREEYVSLIDDVKTGTYTGVAMMKLTDAQKVENQRRAKAGSPPDMPGMPKGIAWLTNMVKLPNGKNDGNNQHHAFISTDLPEENWPYPTSGWEWRDRFAQRLRDYTEGLFYFAQNDSELPDWFRKECAEWGWAKDEYTDNGHFPRQLYVREGRRMKGKYIFKAQDAQPVRPGERPPLHPDSITASHYALDSHAVRKREAGRIHLDGFISYPSAVYTVPFRVIVPDSPLENLLAPVPASATHIGFSTLRMEPCWMALGQAAGTAAALCVQKSQSVHELAVPELQSALLQQKAILVYSKGMATTDPNFEANQLATLKGK